MKTSVLILSLFSLSLFACKKGIITSPDKSGGGSSAHFEEYTLSKGKQYKEYTIYKGKQYSDKNLFKRVNLAKLSFSVKFDSTAIYRTKESENQFDINKLYGFSDNNSYQHSFSARFGWRWSEGALRIFAYTYNEGIRSFLELGTISIGTENFCSIKIAGDKYIFTLNNKSDTVQRKSSTLRATGYKLYPYFGGNETAPHDIHIWIKDLK